MARTKKISVAERLAADEAAFVADVQALTYVPVVTLDETEVEAEAARKVQVEAAWAQHNSEVNPPAAKIDLDNIYVEVDGKRFTPEGKQIYLLNREEIEECYARCTQAKPKEIFKSREEILACAAMHRAKKEEAIRSRRQEKIAEAIADGKFHNLGALQMLAKPSKKAA